MIAQAMIFAAGLGTRLHPLTKYCPKPLLRIGGSPVLFRHIDALLAVKADRIIINVAHLADKIMAEVKAAYPTAPIVFSMEPRPLETAGALYHAKGLFTDGALLLMNADIYTDINIALLPTRLDAGIHGNIKAHLVFYPAHIHATRQDFGLHAGEVVATDSPNTADTADRGARGFTYTGVGVLAPEAITDICTACEEAEKPLSLGPMLHEWVAERAVSGAVHQGVWWDIGTKPMLAAVRMSGAPD